MLETVKKALRISHNQLDGDISDIIEAARLDLSLSGVSSLKANDDNDPLIKRAIIVYAKANTETDDAKADRYQKSYDMLKNHLTLAGDYK